MGALGITIGTLTIWGKNSGMIDLVTKSSDSIFFVPKVFSSKITFQEIYNFYGFQVKKVKTG